MRKATAIACVLVDVGGVLLTDGWDHHARKRAARTFNLKWAEMEERHVLTFETYEEGKLTLEEYLGQVVFYQRRTQRVSDSQVQAGQVCGLLCFLLLCPRPQIRRGALAAGAGHCPGAGPAGPLHRKHLDVR